MKTELKVKLWKSTRESWSLTWTAVTAKTWKQAKIRQNYNSDDDGEDLKRHDGPADDVHTLSDLIFFYNEGRSKSDDVTMRGLCQEAVVTEPKTHTPGVVIWERSKD